MNGREYLTGKISNTNSLHYRSGLDLVAACAGPWIGYQQSGKETDNRYFFIFNKVVYFLKY
jgi:hypothetical protein